LVQDEDGQVWLRPIG